MMEQDNIFSRRERRDREQQIKKHIKEETARRKSGDWGPWETVKLLNGIPQDYMGFQLFKSAPGGWCKEIRFAHRNKVFAVLRRHTEGALHLAITSISHVRPTWWEMQRIKNELAAPEATGVEIYPPQDEVVDNTEVFHLWIIGPVPFTIFERKERNWTYGP